MTLELKHIACYLPYKLKVQTEHIEGNRIYTLEGLSAKYDRVDLDDDYGWSYISGIKPILRPLSDLNKEIEVNGQKFIPINWVENQYPNLDLHNQCKSLLDDESWINQCEYLLIQHLFEWHFDIYNLIKNNLAIDINTIK